MVSSPGAPAPPLRIDDLIGGHKVIQADEELTVGRRGDFPVGTDDRYLHRILFQLWYSGQGWMIANRGSAIPLTVEVRGSRSLSKSDLGPGGVMPMPAGASVITFSTKERSYELNVDISPRGMIRPQKPRDVAPLEPTYSRHTPTLEQQQLLEALAEPLRNKPGATDAEIPRLAEVAERLRWTEKKTSRKIENLWDRLAEDGEKVYKPKHVFLAHYELRRPRRPSR